MKSRKQETKQATHHHDEGSLGLTDLLNRARDDLVHETTEENHGK